ncbi:MAG: hypothetical protein H7A34_07975 [bacterium]|nr:hypothetical protein [bacterium]
MNGAALFVELLVGGVQVVVWVAVLALASVSPDRLMSVLTSHSIENSIVLMSAAYTLGVVFDRVWDALLSPVDKRIRSAFFADPEQAHRIRILLFSGDAVRVQFVEYIRSRIRITRYTVCNALITAVCSGIVFFIRHSEPWRDWFLYAVLFSVVFSACAFYAHCVLISTYYKTLKRFDAHRTLSSK